MFPWGDENSILGFSFLISKSWKQLIYYTSQRFYFSVLDIKHTHSTWDELIELMYLRFLAKWSYAGTYRLFCTFVGTYQYYSLFVTQLIVIQQILEDRILFNFVNLIFKNRILLHFKLRAIVNQKDISHLVA